MSHGNAQTPQSMPRKNHKPTREGHLVEKSRQMRKYSSTGQVGSMNSVIRSCKSRLHPVKPQVAKIVRPRNARTAAPHLPRTVIFCVFGAKKRQHAAKLRAKRLFRRRNGVQAARNNNQVIGAGKLPGLITCFLETLRLHHGHISTSASGTLLTQNRS